MSLPRNEFVLGAKASKGGSKDDYEFGYWHDGNFSRSSKALLEGSVLKKFYLYSATGGKRHNFTKSWFSDVICFRDSIRSP